MKKSTDRLLKVLIVIATLIILSTLAVLAFLNFSAESRNDRSQTVTTVRQVTSSTNSTSSTKTTETTETTEENENSSSTRSRTSSTTTARRNAAVTTTTSEPVKTQRSLSLEEAIEENANEARGERVSTSGSKSFDTQAEAHSYGSQEINRIAREEGQAASYVVEAVRDNDGKVVSWEAKITVS